jgi:serine/threonine protein kinase
MASRGYEEERLQHWFLATDLESKRERFSENDVREITKILETLENGVWSRIPRTYIVLRLIGRLDAVESFVHPDCSDTWFPFTKLSLPTVLRHDAAQFLEAQKLVCNMKALNLERVDTGHCHFPDPDEIPLKKIGQLGKGGSGFVERVISTITHKEYALKLIKRGQTFKKDRRVLRNYEKELANLKKVSHAHRHIIPLVGSYTDPRCVGILFPVADCNLAEFMEQSAETEERWLIRTYFGCLASALSFLHDSSIRHKDIKPHNILIKDREPLFTDFGLALDWSQLGHSTTLGPTGITPQYGAPEVAACEPRNSSSDVWSLGCVFLELWAFLKGASAKNLAAFTTIEGRRLPYHSKDVKLPDLFEYVKELPGPISDSLPCIWIDRMLERERGDRWSAHMILESIQEQSADATTQYIYIGLCCLNEEDPPESVYSRDSADIEDLVRNPETSDLIFPSPCFEPSELLTTTGRHFTSDMGARTALKYLNQPSIPRSRLPGNSGGRIHDEDGLHLSKTGMTSLGAIPNDVAVLKQSQTLPHAYFGDGVVLKQNKMLPGGLASKKRESFARTLSESQDFIRNHLQGRSLGSGKTSADPIFARKIRHDKIEVKCTLGPIMFCVLLDLEASGNAFLSNVQSEFKYRNVVVDWVFASICFHSGIEFSYYDTWFLSTHRDTLEADWQKTVHWLRKNKRHTAPHMHSTIVLDER